MQRTSVDRFRVAARPVSFVVSTEVIIEDVASQLYLLDWEQAQLSDLTSADLAALGTFFEASQDCTWYALADLRAILGDSFLLTPVHSGGLSGCSSDLDRVPSGSVESSVV